MAATENRDLVIARDFGPKARRFLVLLALALMTVGYTGYMASQTLTVVIIPREGASPSVLLGETGLDPREAGPGLLLGLFSGALGGAGLGVLLYAFAHPMVRHRALPYILLVLAGQLLAALTTPALLRVVREAGGVVRVTTGPFHLPKGVDDFLVQSIPGLLFLGTSVLIAWVLLRPEDFEGTRLYRSYLARDLLPPEPPVTPPPEEALP